MLKQNRFVLAIAGVMFLAIVVLEMAAPANIVGAYGFVLPILLVATVRSRSLMLVTVLACIVVTYMGLMQPTKPGRFQAAVINRSVVAGVLLVVAYIGMTWEERKTREEAARAALARETENLLKANTQLVDAKDQLNRSERLAAVGQLVASVAHEVGTPLHSIAWHVQALAEEPGVTPDMKKRVTVIDEQLTRVVRIIQDLLSSTRQRQPEPTWLPVEQVISQAVALMEPGLPCERDYNGGRDSREPPACLGRCGKDASSDGEHISQCLSRHPASWSGERIGRIPCDLVRRNRPRSSGRRRDVATGNHNRGA